MNNFRKLQVWEEAIRLGFLVYQQTERFPSQEQFGLTAQMRSAAVSVSSNIAEGAGRGSGPDMARLLRIALGSLAELESQVEISTRLGYLEASDPVAEAIPPLRGKIKGLHSRLTGSLDR